MTASVDTAKHQSDIERPRRKPKTHEIGWGQKRKWNCMIIV